MRILLHYYPESPFSEKIRRALALKGLSWIGVAQPAIMPKPDQTALTGGYRKAPVLQIGANVYCDSRLIAEVIESLQPTPTLFPEGHGSAARMLANWCDQNVFRVASIMAFKNIGSAAGISRKEAVGLLRDRSALMKDASVLHVPTEDAPAWLRGWLRPLEKQLGASDFLCGAAASIADCALYHPLWFMDRAGLLGATLAPYPALQRWYKRIQEWPDTRSEEWSGQQAIDEANAHVARAPADAGVVESSFQAGAQVQVLATDYGFEPTSGQLVSLNDSEIIIQHHNERVRDAMVHFPRFGYRLAAPVEETT